MFMSPVFFYPFGFALLGLGSLQFRLNFSFLSLQTFQDALHVRPADLTFTRRAIRGRVILRFATCRFLRAFFVSRVGTVFRSL